MSIEMIKKYVTRDVRNEVHEKGTIREGLFLRYIQILLSEIEKEREKVKALEMSLPKDPFHLDCIIVSKSGFDAFLTLSRQRAERAEEKVKESQFAFDEMVNVASEQTEAYRKEKKRTDETEFSLSNLQGIVRKHKEEERTIIDDFLDGKDLPAITVGRLKKNNEELYKALEESEGKIKN